MMIIDKGYYDYDYKYVEPKEEKKVALVEDTRKSESELNDILKKFGWKPQTHDAKALQELVIKDINERNNRGVSLTK